MSPTPDLHGNPGIVPVRSLRPLWRELGGFPIDRRLAGVPALQVALALLERGNALCVFPEGRRNRSDGLLPFHGGAAWLAIRTGAPNVYIDTSAYVARRFPAEFLHYLRGHGRRKVLFGTNYPMITAEQSLEHLRDLELDPEAESMFLSGNAARVFEL